MRTQSRIAAGMAVVCGLLLTAGGAARVNAKQIPQQTQQQQQQQNSNRLPSFEKDPMGPDPIRDRMQEQASRARNTDRHKRLVADTEKLLALSTELKADVDKTTKNEMSVEVIRKAAEIERLAHDVKERMKG